MNVLKYISLLSLAVAGVSCGDLRDTYDEYLGDGERIYVGKLSEVKLLPGYERMVVTGATRYMKTAEKCLIELEETATVYEAEVDASQPEFSYEIRDLKAGNYYVKITSVDCEGNLSVPETYNIDVYGEGSADAYYPKRITAMNFDLSDGSITLVWSQADNVAEVRLTYCKGDGSTAELLVDGTASSTKLTDWQASSPVTAVSYVLPSEDALDRIELEPITDTLPADPVVEIPRDRFADAALPSDAAQGYGGAVDKLWNNDTWNYDAGYHTADGVGVPHHVTIDMGLTATLTECEVFFTGFERFDWIPRLFQVWGLEDVPDLAACEADVPSIDPGFEASAKEKGWKLLTEENVALVGWVSSIRFPLKRVDGIRYVRYRVVEAYNAPHTGTSVYGNATEIKFWGLGRKIGEVE